MLFEWLFGWLGKTGNQAGTPACFEGGHGLATTYAGSDDLDTLYLISHGSAPLYSGSDERC